MWRNKYEICLNEKTGVIVWATFPLMAVFSERFSGGFKSSEKKIKKMLDDLQKMLIMRHIESTKRNA